MYTHIHKYKREISKKKEGMNYIRKCKVLQIRITELCRERNSKGGVKESRDGNKEGRKQNIAK